MSKIAVRSDASKAGAPAKPRKDFPLFPHARGYWAKKVKGKMVYFGKIADDPKGKAALAAWLQDKDGLLADKPVRSSRGLTIEDLCDHFLTAKEKLIASGELTRRTYDEYHATGDRLIKAFGATTGVYELHPEDFDKLRASIAKQWGPVRLGNEIQRVRTIFRFGLEADLIDRPVKLGPSFKKPNRKVMRKARAAKGPKMIEAAHLRKLIDAAGIPMKAFILLALNAGLGNNDVGRMPLPSAADLARGWIVYPRPKTGVERKFPLWPETLEAVKAAIKARPTPKTEEAKGLAFVTKYGGSWAKETTDNPVSKEFRKLLDEHNLHRPGLGFYSLRHIFATIGGESRDQSAVSSIMGHIDESMAGVYRESISDARLQAVVDHVHGWLFPP
ncbi:MAG TPA: tyrosine-type recombinase/integrase [Pirellulales bacterium]|jgi:integrase|nr:tyrosine-type recombinase/integrase [Pirellulales bacterium]